MKRSGKILLEGTIEEFKKHCKGADNREYLLINTKEIKKDGTYTIYQQDSNTERVTSISAKGKYGEKYFIPYEEYLTLVATSAGTFLFTGLGANKILYSKDKGETWSEPLQTVTINVQKGNSVLWKGEMTPYIGYNGSGIGTFGGTATFEAKGNVMSLLFGDNYIGKTSLEGKSQALCALWIYSKIVKAHNLSLPAKILSTLCYGNMFAYCSMLTTTPELPAITLADYCYLYMFLGCTSLTRVPSLPATTLASNCYGYMFSGCTSLTTIPETLLPATTLANSCYYYMFNGCNSLKKAPELPATTVVAYCYNSMFLGCTSLTQAPKLPAITLANYCYLLMFYGCSSLNYIKMLATDISANSCLYNWVSNVANSGTFVKATKMMTLPTDNTSGIPSGWTVEDFPRNYLKFVAKSQGKFNFSSTTASNMILYSIDNGGTWSTPSSLISINVNIGDLIMWKGEMTPTENGIGSFNKSTAAFDIEGNIMSLLYGDNFELQTYLKGDSSTFKYLFSKTKVNSAKNLALPSTILVESCYESMFQECTELVKAPHLPAATLTASCYKNMFKDCTSLNYIEMVATDISASYCLLNWVNNVAETGVLIIDENQTEIPIGDSGIPLGWTSYSVFSYYSPKYLTLVAKNSGAFNFKGTSSNMIQYSTNNGETWSEPSNDVTVNVTKDDSVLWKGEMTPSSSLGIGNFANSTASFDIEGNAMSLLYGDNFIGLTDLTDKNYVFYNLFHNSLCINAKNLILPATTLASNCYSDMFYKCSILETTPLLPALVLMYGCYSSMFAHCTKLTKAPKLPATQLANFCYANMFQDTALIVAPLLPATTLTSQCYQMMFTQCKSLVEAPSLPAETLASSCYSSMFSSCTSLVSAPQLPATTLAQYCYESMFRDCVNLTTAPTLLANTLEQRSYYSMFSGCTSLTTAPSLNITTLGKECCTSMFNGCTSLESAPSILPATTLASKCYASMFYNCTSLTQAPELPATTLASECYSLMFYNCTSLTTPPELPATTLANSCYESMFYNCTGLNTTPLLPATVLKKGCYNLMFSGTNVLPDCTNIDFTSQSVVASGGLKGLFKGTKITDNDLRNILPINPQTKHYWLPVTTLATECYYQMFGDCQYLVTAPELPATTLANKCYQYMFSKCTSLTTVSVLPATTLASSCYSLMFGDCTSLTTAPELKATTLADNCYFGMFLNCSSLINAPQLPVTTLASSCYYYMFKGCTSLTTAPQLPATMLVSSCYYQMFLGCTKLNYIKMLATDISASNCLLGWVYGVASSGTFVKNAAMSSLPRSDKGIPYGWTVEDATEIVEDATE